MSNNQDTSEILEDKASTLKNMLGTCFDLNQHIEEPAFTNIPMSTDISYEYISLDINRLNRVKKSNFWTYLIENLPLHLRFGETLTIEKLISFYPKYEEPLFKMKANLHFFVEKIYNWILSLLSVGEKKINPEKKIKNIINLCLEKEKVLVNEVYLILIKLFRNNPNKEMTEKLWQLIACISACLLPSEDFIFPIYFYFFSIIDNHPEERYKEWAKYSLKRLYFLDKNSFKRNFAPSSVEIKYTKTRKKIPIQVFFKNGTSEYLYVEPYVTIGDLKKLVLEHYEIDKNYWNFFGILESVERTKSENEKLLAENVLIGDVLSSWDIIRRISGENLKKTRIYLHMTYFPIETQKINYLLDFILYEYMYNIYYSKTNLERFELLNLWSLAFQLEFGDFEEKPGFIKTKMKNYFHPYFLKYYNDERFIEQLVEKYQNLKGQSREQCTKKFLGIDDKGKHKLCHYFRVNFRNSNNANFRDMQQNIILGINDESITLYEEISRENIMKIKLEEVMNWGINKDILVLCYGDQYEVTKLYFQCYNPFEIAEILYNYSNQRVSDKNYDILGKYNDLEKFVVNPKVRKMNIFAYR